MPRHQNAFIFIEKGEPYSKGTLILLSKKRITIGRHFTDDQPDIALNNPVISRDHLIIEWKNGSYRCIDGNSKNGTKINDKKLEKSTYYEIHNGDRLCLADDAAILLFSYNARPTTLTIPIDTKELNIRFNAERRELFVDDKKIVLSGNLYKLFEVLYNNRGKVVSHSEIKEAVWSDRARDEKGDPLTTEEEINVLMMRLRKKLGTNSKLLNNIRGYGYLLDIK
jgi:pSer/pThr/pTyr-binding forkhead associated (FHA) protein